MMSIPGRLRRHLTAAALATVVVAVFAGCGIFFISPYPDFVTLLDARADLSTAVLTGSNIERRMEVETDGVHTFIYLIESPQTQVSSLSHLVVMDTDLNVLYSGTNAGFGNSHFVDASGMFVVGDQEFDPSVTPISFSPVPLAPGYTLNTYPTIVFDGTSYYSLSTSAAAGSYPVVSTSMTFSGNWASAVSGGPSYNLSNDTSISQLDIDSIFTDATAGVTAIVYSSGTSTQSALHMIKFKSASFGSLTAPLESAYLVSIASPTNVNRLYYTRRGMVTLTNSGNLEVLTAGGAISTLAVPDLYRLTLGFDPSGNTFYMYDRETQEVSRCRTWW